MARGGVAVSTKRKGARAVALLLVFVLGPLLLGDPAAAANAHEPSPARVITLGPDGLGVVAVGRPQSQAVSAISRDLGPPTSTVGGVCPGRTEVQWHDLALEFSQRTLTGYRYREGGFPTIATRYPRSGPGEPVLKTAPGATLGMSLAQVRVLYPPKAFSEEQGGSIVVLGKRLGDRLFLGFFASASWTPLTEIKGGDPCGNV